MPSWCARRPSCRPRSRPRKPAPRRLHPPVPPEPNRGHAWSAEDIGRINGPRHRVRPHRGRCDRRDGRRQCAHHRAGDRPAAEPGRQRAPNRQNPHIRITQDEGDTMRTAVEASIVLRANPQGLPANDPEREMARNYRGMSLMEVGRTFLEETQGVRLRGLSKRELATVLLGSRYPRRRHALDVGFRQPAGERRLEAAARGLWGAADVEEDRAAVQQPRLQAEVGGAAVGRACLQAGARRAGIQLRRHDRRRRAVFARDLRPHHRDHPPDADQRRPRRIRPAADHARPRRGGPRGHHVLERAARQRRDERHRGAVPCHPRQPAVGSAIDETNLGLAEKALREQRGLRPSPPIANIST
jgi:hypothetical protein